MMPAILSCYAVAPHRRVAQLLDVAKSTIDAHRTRQLASLKPMAAVAAVREECTRSGPARPGGKDALERMVTQSFVAHKGKYGIVRLCKYLNREGTVCSVKQVRRCLHKSGLKASQRRRFIPKTTQAGTNRFDNLLIAPLEQTEQRARNVPNLRARQEASRFEPGTIRFDPTGINQCWCSDITYLWMDTQQTWLYLCAWQDMYSRKVVSHQVNESMLAELVSMPLQRALIERDVGAGLIVHSDAGGQYSAKQLDSICTSFKLKRSMTRSHNTYDNAMAESLWSRLKAELDGGPVFSSLSEARYRIGEYIEFYNHTRLHSSLDYVPPTEFEALQKKHSEM